MFRTILESPLRILVPLLLVAGLAGAQVPTGRAAPGSATTTGFESFTTGSVNGQQGWTSGHGSSFCPLYDEGIVSNTYGYAGFGAQSLRISNAITCGSFNDQTFSASLADEAGETSATTSTFSGGTRQPYFEAQWDFASTVPSSEQPGLSVVASPDRGDPDRMSWLQMTDTPSGLQLNFEDYQHSLQNFVLTPIASGLDRTLPHTVKLTVAFVDGASNDVVTVYLDGARIYTGTSWEDYFRDVAGGSPHPVDSIMFRVAGTAAPVNAGHGFLIDNFSSFSGQVPTADLSGLSLSSGTLSPAFDPSTSAYSASVDNATTNVVVSASTNPGATAVVSGNSNLAVGGNSFTITVTTGATTKTYTVSVDRAAATPAMPPTTAPAISGPSIAQVPAETAPPSPTVAAVPDLTGLTADQARALAVSRGLTVGTVTTRFSSEPSDTVIGQDPWPLPAYLPLGGPINIVVSQQRTSAPLIVKVAASRRVPLAIRHSFTPLIFTTIAAKATISLTGYTHIRRAYATWSRTLKAGANYVTLRIPRHLKIKLPGVYRLSFSVQSEGQSVLYSVRLRLSLRVLRAPLPKREADVLLVTAPSISDRIVGQLSARYRVMTVETGTVFTATHAPNERVGAVVLDAHEAGLGTIRHLHFVFPDLRIVAVVSSPAAAARARAAGASRALVEPTSAGLLFRALGTPSGR